MPTARWIAVLSVVPVSFQQSAPPPSPAAVPSLFAWGDLDGDQRLDLAAITPGGELRMLWNDGAGRFHDRTAEYGLASVTDAALACWADFDGDGRADLFVGARAGASRLLRNDAGVLVDVTREAGLAVAGPVLDARWLDHDGDARPDLHVTVAGGSRIFRGLEGGTFQEMALELEAAQPPANLSTATPMTVPATEGTEYRRTPAPEPTSNESGARIPVAALPSTGPGGAAPLTWATGCMDTLEDQANPGACLAASSTPSLGLLYPLSTDLFVAPSGEVGIGTTSPAARLDVAGDARITGLLELDPGTDVALDLVSGGIALQGTRFVHGWEFAGNTAVGFDTLPTVWAGANNTALGSHALSSATTGIANTAAGASALAANTTGGENTAIGRWSLANNTSGDFNSGIGSRTLWFNTTGTRNVAVGSSALENNTSGELNVAVGRSAMSSNSTGGSNTAVGYQALYSNTTASSSTAIGARALFSNTTGVQNTAVGTSALDSNGTGGGNTAVGYDALESNSTGFSNTAVGAGALASSSASYNTAVGNNALNDSTSGFGNSALGHAALAANTTGSSNLAGGYQALQGNTTGIRNVALGESALLSNTDGTQNTAVGGLALNNLASGSGNIALGGNAGTNLTSGSNNITIGTTGASSESTTIRLGAHGLHTRTFVGGVRGVTTSAANAIPVLIDSVGQLGTVSSSRRFKEDIRDMGELSERLLALRPVVFRYTPEVQSGERPLEYGLIAEEVAETFPELAVLDDEGQPFTVKYHVLGALLLNELQEQSRELESLRARVAELEQAR